MLVNFASSGWSVSANTDTLLALGHVDGADLSSVTTDFSVPTSKFVNVSVNLVGSIFGSQYVYIFGTGTYRASAVYLARVPPSQLANHDAWTYYRGRQNGVPDFGPGEDTAAAQLVPITCGGEISVRQHPPTGLWLMTYNCGSPRGINLRTAPSLTGPWSDPAFDPWADGGYERFMHVPVSWAGFDDGLANSMGQRLRELGRRVRAVHGAAVVLDRGAGRLSRRVHALVVEPGTRCISSTRCSRRRG
jgi:hypothetical protein